MVTGLRTATAFRTGVTCPPIQMTGGKAKVEAPYNLSVGWQDLSGNAKGGFRKMKNGPPNCALIRLGLGSTNPQHHDSLSDILKGDCCWWSSRLSFTNQILMLYADSLFMKVIIVLGLVYTENYQRSRHSSVNSYNLSIGALANGTRAEYSARTRWKWNCL